MEVIVRISSEHPVNRQNQHFLISSALAGTLPSSSKSCE
jgi:hypothetical protein